MKVLKYDREPEYSEVKLTPATIDRTETADEKKKRDAANDRQVDKAEKQHEEDLKKWKEKTFGGNIREEAENKTKSVLCMMLGDEGQKRFHARLPYANELAKDIFIANMRDLELQRKFCKKIKAADEVWQEAIAHERGTINQKHLKAIRTGQTPNKMTREQKVKPT